MFMRSCLLFLVCFGCVFAKDLNAATEPLTETAVKEIVEKEVKRLTKDMWAKKSSDILSIFLKKTLKKMQALLEASFKIAAQEAIKEIMREDSIKAYMKETRNQTMFPIIGNPKGSQVILIFTDPYCNYCHESLTLYERYAQKDRSFKLIIHDFPLGGKHSYNAVRALLAAHAEKKHPLLRKALHKRHKENRHFFSTKELANLAKEHGIPSENFEEKMHKKNITQAIRETLKLAKQFQITATPSFVILKSDHQKPRVEEGVIAPEELLKPPAS